MLSRKPLSDQFAALNLFRESVHRSALPSVVLVQRIKTFCFIFLVPVIGSVIVTLTATSPLVQQITVANPTIADYERLQPHNPVCPCERPISGAEYVNISWHPATDIAKNACAAIGNAWALQVSRAASIFKICIVPCL
jgi:hypothetical protein